MIKKAVFTRNTVMSNGKKPMLDFLIIEPNPGTPIIGNILFGHGIGQGDNVIGNVEEVLNTGLPKELMAGKEIPYRVFCPQAEDSSPGNAWFGREGLTGLGADGKKLSQVVGTNPDGTPKLNYYAEGRNMVDIMYEMYGTKPETSILTGLSGGGKAAQMVAILCSDKFSVLALACPAGYPVTNAAKLKNMRCLFIHSKDDKRTAFADTVLMVNAIKAAGGTVELIEFENKVAADGGHAEAWQRLYKDGSKFYEIIKPVVVPVPTTTTIPAQVININLDNPESNPDASIIFTGGGLKEPLELKFSAVK